MITEFTLFTTLALHHLLIGGALTLILLGLVRLVNTSAEMRSWLWMTVFLAATLIPFTLIKSEKPVAEAAIANESVMQMESDTGTLVAATEQLQYSSTNWHVPGEWVYSLKQYLSVFMFIWLIGSLWRGFSVLKSFLRTRQLIASCQLLSADSELQDKIRKDSYVDLYTSGVINSPMVTGLFSPKIILPENMVNHLECAQLAPIVLHEQAHIQRHDIGFGLLQELIAIIFWWSPVIRVLNRKIHVERELACDLRAAKQLSNQKQYAQSLVDCAKLMITQHRSVLAMGLFSQKKELSRRVSEVLKSNNIKTPNLTIIISVCLGLTLATVQAAHSFAPKISIDDVLTDSRHYSLLAQGEGEKLLQAVIDNNLDAIVDMQNAGVDINIPVIGEGTALIIAVKQNNRAMVQALIELGADVNQSSLRDGNPLINAAMLNNIELAKLLLDQGADVNAIVPRDETPLINATRRGYFEMSQLLVSRGADVNLEVQTGAGDGYQIRSPLNMARTQEIRDYLIANGARDSQLN